ncbi:MAG: type II toxin-antitoxin system RelE/ParE family toxin [bacterium]|jgi:toxin ParE1/3/4
MYKLLITRSAEQDLDGIVDYIAVKLMNPSAASALLDIIGECYGSLKSTPRMFSECGDTYLKNKRYRKALIDNYLLIFRIDENSNTVYVLRFFYGAQDYIKQL